MPLRELFTRTANIKLIKKGTVCALRRETKFIFKPKVRGAAKVRGLIPVQIAQHPRHSQFGLSVDFRARSWADLGGVTIHSITCSCPFARGSWTCRVPVCLSDI